MILWIIYFSGKRDTYILSKLSFNDPLTGVLNRRAFDLAAENMLSSTRDAAMIFFDIDYFKQVNDKFGHDTGDQLLVKFSDVLKKNFSDLGLVSRYGGDEFVVLAQMDESKQITELLKQTMADVHDIKLSDDGREDKDRSKSFVISCSAGAARYPRDAQKLSDLQKCADIAVYTVKERGRNAYLWYSASYVSQNDSED